MFAGLTPLFRTALAWSVLAGAPGDPLPPYDADLADEVRGLARHYQLVDASTMWSYFTHEHYWERHANTLRAHAAELRPCPLLEECCFLPPRALCGACLSENNQYEQWLNKELLWGGPSAPGLSAALQETRDLWQVWNLAVRASAPAYNVYMRRHALYELRGLVGHDNFYSGRLPPHLPVWRLPRYP